MPGQRPNILLITVHDLGTRLGCYGVPNVNSPHLDQLALDGVRFTRNFATATFCSPSRGSIITGQYPHVNGLMGLTNLGWEWRESNRTLAKALGQAGYETFLFGLQHETRPDSVERLGFEHLSSRSVGTACKHVVPLVEDFLGGRGSEGDRPFYARVGFSEVHRPYRHSGAGDPAEVTLPGHILDTPGAREDFAAYDADIHAMDAAVGRILAALEAGGLTDSTVVVFTTDHGSPFPRAKSTLYDPGINTALVLRWSTVFRAGRTVEQLVSNVDLFPTLLDVAGATPSGNIQGRTLLPLLEGREHTVRNHIFAEKNTQPGDARRCVRTERFKYIRNYEPGVELPLPTDVEISLTRRDMGNDHLGPRPEVELYDLAADPGECTNLAGAPAFTEQEQQLAALLADVMADTGDPLLAGPIDRPAAESDICRANQARVAERCTFPREGLLRPADVTVQGFKTTSGATVAK